MRLKEMAVSTKDLFMLDPRLIQEKEGFNVRQPGPEMDAHIQCLADSIREIGVQEPLTIYTVEVDGIRQVFLSNGHCRLAAVRRLIAEGAEIRAVPCRVEERANDADRVLAMITRNSGLPLTPYEAGLVFKRLEAYGWTLEEISAKTGKGLAYVRKYLGLTEAPAEVLASVQDGSVSPHAAAVAVKKHGPERATEVIRKAKDDAMAKGRSRAATKVVAPTSSDRWNEAVRRMKELLVRITEARSDEELAWAIGDIRIFLDLNATRFSKLV